MLDGLQIIKRGISTDLFKFIKPLDKTSFVEEYENPSKKETETKKEEIPKETEVKQDEEPAKAPPTEAPAEAKTS